MKCLVIGGGGREHALVWKLAQSRQVTKLYCAPGNGGIAQIAECLPFKATEIEAIVRFAKSERIDLCVIGPETPLIAGLADALEVENLKVFGASAKAAQLEGSKAFSKTLMQKYTIPTAEFKVFNEPEAAKAYAQAQSAQGKKLVVKASGEALGKGAIVTDTMQDALDAIEMLMVHKMLGEAGAQIVIEERLTGREASMMAFTDGETISMLPPAQDFKRVFDGDKGPNTGGMGCYSPVPFVTESLRQEVLERVIEPTVRAMESENAFFKGLLYPGLLFQNDQPYTLEYNCRFGDPETECLLPLLDSDLFEVLLAVAEKRLASVEIRWKPLASVCVIMASGGYPNDYQTGFPITGIAQAERDPQVNVFHAGTRLEGDQVVTGGGRVLAVSALGKTVEEARGRAYEACSQISFERAFYRRDIALNVEKLSGFSSQ